jgi:hypothetical protein
MADEDRPPDLTPAEAARARRRDRDAEAKARKGMRTGLAKQFKQILDAQSRRAEETAEQGEQAAQPPPASAESSCRRASRGKAGRPQDRQPR